MAKTKYTKAQVKENQEAWLKKLESGRYKQIQNFLVHTLEDSDKKKQKFGFCCLGVAMQSLGCKRIKHPYNDTYYGFQSNPQEGTEDGYFDIELSQDATDALGLVSSSGHFYVKSLKKKNPDLYALLRDKYGFKFEEATELDKSSLVGLNDDYIVPFKLLAQVIRTKPEGLFKSGY